jgi:2'-5' RNA ligase
VDLAGPASKVRLFLALWPGPAVRQRLVDARDGWNFPAGAAPVRPVDLHLTLHFIGNVEAARLPELAVGLAVPFQRFELNFGTAELWPRGIAVTRPNAVPARLLALHAALAERLVQLGLPVERRRYAPHVTLARKAVAAQLPPRPAALRWSAHGYALIQSRPVAAGGYRRLIAYA